MLSHPCSQDGLSREGRHTLVGREKSANPALLISINLFCGVWSFLEEKKPTYMEVFVRDLYGIRHVGLFFGLHDAASQGYDTLEINQSTLISHKNQI